MRRAASHPVVQLMIVMLMCALIAIPKLDQQGLTSSEGHRVIPAIEMLESGAYLVPTMFEQEYVRKPQMVPWLFSLALRIHPDPDLSPRLVSGTAFTLMVLGSWFFARRWFGSGAGFSSALALGLTPLYWSPARAAEIESVHNLFTAIGAWIVIELCARRHPRAKAFAWQLALCTISLCMLLTKGPAGFPIMLGILIGCTVLTSGPRERIYEFVRPSIWIPVIIAALIFAWHWSNTLEAAGPNAVVQAPSAFMFEPGRLLKLAGFVPVALLTALPLSLAILFPWGPDARAEAALDQSLRKRLRIAKIIALAVPCALVVMMLTGVSNDRYAQPILAPIAPLVGWLLTTPLSAKRASILRSLTLGRPAILAAVLSIGFVVYLIRFEPERRSSSGKIPAQIAAIELIKSLDQMQTERTPILVAHNMIEARPETLLYIRMALQDAGHDLDIRWIPKLDPQHMPSGTLAMLRTDQNGNESDKVLIDSMIATGIVHEFSFSIVLIQDQD
ncbi:MAG: glycosyltransferase family 39 protein [Phycisphaerales bacterium]|nr:glycosyltransferase family 39 protein [Phycisphaerales bacterium]